MLPSSQTVLTILSVAAPIIAAISGIWGIAKELSTKNDEGDKHLTKAGKIAIALTASSALVGAVAIGFRAEIEQRAKADAASLTAQKNAADKQYRLDEQNWRGLNDRQQKLLAAIGTAETRRVGQNVVSNDKLLAALSEQRDWSIAAAQQLFQLGQSQRIVLKSQPLRTLRMKLTFGGFSSQQIDEFEKGIEKTAWYSKSDDDYERMADAKPYLDAANDFRHVFVPMMEIMVEGDDHSETTDLIMAVDMDGTGTWTVPVGWTKQVVARGLVFNDVWLFSKGDVYGTVEDNIKQDSNPCTVPNLAVDRASKSVQLFLEISGNCLQKAVHRSGEAVATSRILDSPAIVFYRGGPEKFPISAQNVTEMDDWI